jgi:hypothetical protein
LRFWPISRRSVVTFPATAAAGAVLAGGAAGQTQTQNQASRPLYEGRLDSFRGKSPAQTLQELVDREQIRDLIAIYAHRVAHGVSIADLFTDDGVYINRRGPDGPVSEARGRKALEARFGKMSAPGTAMPMIHNYLLSIHGDEATGICSNELRITENGQSIIASGYYQDKLRRETGQWKFVVRDVTFFHWVADPGGMGQEVVCSPPACRRR